MEIYCLDPYFWKLFPVLKQKRYLSYVKQHLNCYSRNYTTGVSGYFGFKVIYLKMDIGYPRYFFTKCFCFAYWVTLSALNNILSTQIVNSKYSHLSNLNNFGAIDFSEIGKNRIYQAKTFCEIKIGRHRCSFRVK